ncbi:MAG TPA: class I SAM-dependent methyltransferase [Gammaproteobacteria bacterium]|nr:class I SAM-dependent methyltransferase [Gammaproteobacteria bacterium]
MPSLSVLRTLLREATAREHSPRVNEPDLVMDDPEKVAAYTRAGREDGVMAPVYLFHCAQICEIIRPGDNVVDLGCGPATQLVMVARLNSGTQFVGVDLSPGMLDKARSLVTEQALSNVELRTEDITRLSSFADASVDAVMSTVALHHLPDLAALECCFKEVNRILKPDGGLYLVDFGHLKSEKSIDYFAHQYADRQPELFTLDYLYSLRAAFSLKDFKHLTDKCFTGQTKIYSTFLMPFMVAVKRHPEGVDPEPGVISQLQEIRDNLPRHHKNDLSDLMTFFRMGGLQSPLLE